MFEASQIGSTSAEPETLWRVLSEVAEWPRWHPGYMAASIEGELTEGARGTVTLPNGAVRPFIVWEADPPRFLRYGTVDFGNEVAFAYRFNQTGDGRTSVTTSATIRGWLSPVLARLFGRVIAGYKPDELRQLIAAAESPRLVAGK
jgi:hypothetical protein